MKILVTGGCGFIGSELVRTLMDSETVSEIRVLDSLKEGSRDLLPVSFNSDLSILTGGVRKKICRLIIGDVRDFACMVEASIGIDCIIHLAANTGVQQSIEQPMEDFDVNLNGSLNCLEAARVNSVGRVVFATSAAVLGESDPPLNESLLRSPISPYGASKGCGELYASAYWHSYGVSTIVLRFSNVFGPRCNHKNSVVAKMIKDGFSNGEIVINGSGAQTRDFIYVSDIASALVLSSTATAKFEIYHVATGVETSIKTLAEAICSLFERRLGRAVDLSFKPSLKGDVTRSFSSSDKIGRDLNWVSSVSVQDGLAEVFDDLVGAYSTDD